MIVILYLYQYQPSFEDGKINLQILDDCLRDISSISTNEDTIFLIRSTIVLAQQESFKTNIIL